MYKLTPQSISSIQHGAVVLKVCFLEPILYDGSYTRRGSMIK